MTASVAVGIDVGARHLHLVGLDAAGGLAIVDTVPPGEFAPLLSRCAAGACIAIDAPDEQRVPRHVDDVTLGGKFRTAPCAEIALGRRRGYWVPWVTPPVGAPVTSWMEAGFEVWRTVRAAGFRAIEVFPYAAFRTLAGGAPLAKKSKPLGAVQRAQLLDAAAGLRLVTTASHDARDAAVAAVIARDALAGTADEVRCEDAGREHDGSAMWLPAALAGPLRGSDTPVW